MKNLKTTFIAAALITMGSFANAQTSVPNTFEAGGAATAASVNANFTALVDAIDELSARIDGLEQVSLEDLVGRTYCISYFGNSAESGSQNFARTETFVGTTKLTISSTTLGTLTDDSDNNYELNWSLGFDDTTQSQTLDSALNTDGETGTTSININSLTNGVLSVTIPASAGDPAETITFNMNPNGSVIVGTEFSSGSGEGEASIIVGMDCTVATS